MAEPRPEHPGVPAGRVGAAEAPFVMEPVQSLDGASAAPSYPWGVPVHTDEGTFAAPSEDEAEDAHADWLPHYELGHAPQRTAPALPVTRRTLSASLPNTPGVRTDPLITWRGHSYQRDATTYLDTQQREWKSSSTVNDPLPLAPPAKLRENVARRPRSVGVEDPPPIPVHAPPSLGAQEMRSALNIEIPTPLYHVPPIPRQDAPTLPPRPNAIELPPPTAPAELRGSAVHTPMSVPPPPVASTPATPLSAPGMRPVYHDTLALSDDDDEDDDQYDGGASMAPGASTFPHQDNANDMLDFSRMNRRPPRHAPPRSVPFKGPIGACDLFRDTLVATVQDKIRVAVMGDGPEGFTDKHFTPSVDHYAALHSPANLSPTSRELRVTALAFCPPVAVVTTEDAPPVWREEGRVVWYGTHAGHLVELDTHTGHLTALCTTIHKDRIVLVRRVSHAMLVLDDSGKISVWVQKPGLPFGLAHTQPHCQRITLPKHAHASVLGDQLWVCYAAPPPKTAGTPPVHLLQYVSIYNPMADDRPFNAVSQPLTMPLSKGDGVGLVTCSAIVSPDADHVYLGHESGHISVWSVKESKLRTIYRVDKQPLAAMIGLHTTLWVGTRSGHITLYNVQAPLWRVTKSWLAHHDAITSLVFDPYGIQSSSTELPVCSVGGDQFIQFWDGFLVEDWVDHELGKAAASFSTKRTLRLLEVTFNIGASVPGDLLGTVDNLEVFQRILRNSCSFSAPSDPERPDEYCDAQSSPDVIVVGFQELIDLNDKRLTAKNLFLGNKRREGKDLDAKVSRQHKAWHEQLINFVRLVFPPEAPYEVLVSESMVGLFTIIFVKTSIRARTHNVTHHKVKTGFGGRYGNKGAIVTRLLVDDTSFCLINCHLAAGQRKVRERNEDVTDIMQHAFPLSQEALSNEAFAGSGDSTMVLDHEACFFAGDLNYRLDLQRSAVLQCIQQQRYDELVAADQLQMQLRHNVAFRLRGFHEAPIHFAPTYKLNRHANEWDTSEKARVPAYCDRILWRGFHADTIRCTSYKRWDATFSDHRPVSATFRVRVKSVDAGLRAQIRQEKLEDADVYKQKVLAETLRFFRTL